MSSDVHDFEAVLRLSQGSIRSYIAGMGIPAHAVDDVAQDVFLVYFRNPETCPADVEPVRWLKGIARHHALSWFRRHAGSEHRLELMGLMEAQMPDVAEERVDDARLDALRRCLSLVSSGSRNMLDEHYRDGESTEAIAQKRGVNSSAIRMALLRLRERLRTCVERRVSGEAMP